MPTEGSWDGPRAGELMVGDFASFIVNFPHKGAARHPSALCHYYVCKCETGGSIPPEIRRGDCERPTGRSVAPRLFWVAIDRRATTRLDKTLLLRCYGNGSPFFFNGRRNEDLLRARQVCVSPDALLRGLARWRFSRRNSARNENDNSVGDFRSMRICWRGCSWYK